VISSVTSMVTEEIPDGIAVTGEQVIRVAAQPRGRGGRSVRSLRPNFLDGSGPKSARSDQRARVGPGPYTTGSPRMRQSRTRLEETAGMLFLRPYCIGAPSWIDTMTHERLEYA
jgi:hypothetical protein